jgi:GH3 auxin-responsive promoter
MFELIKNDLESSFFSPIFRKISLFVGRVMLRRLLQQMRQAKSVNAHTLWKTVEKNQYTEFGQKHRFGSLLASPYTIKAYKEVVPLSTYRDYEEALARMQRGQQNVLVAEPLSSFTATSGTTGSAKLVPRTRTHQRIPTMIAGLINPATASGRFLKGVARGKGICLLTCSGSIGNTEAGIPVGEHSAMGMRRIAGIIPHLWCSPTEVFFLEDAPTARYLHALYGLCDRQAQYIAATYAPYTLQWMIDMEQRWSEAITDIECGTLSKNLILPPAIRQSLEARLTPNPTRAAELRAAAAQGFKGIVPRIWPQMAYVETVTTGSFAAYVPALSAYIGDIPLFSSFYGASESPIGVGLWPDRPRDYALLVGCAYYEFVPLADADQEQPKTVDLDFLIVGEFYEVVVTNFSGFYRYRMGDIVKVVGRYAETPILNFSHRRGTILNLAGERTTEAQIAIAITRLAETRSNEKESCLRDYTTAIDRSVNPPRYVFYIEPLGEPSPAAIAALDAEAQLLDTALSEANYSFQVQRRNGLIGKPQIKLLDPGSFNLLCERLALWNPKRNRNQLKVPRYMTDNQQLALLEEQAIAASSQARDREICRLMP